MNDMISAQALKKIWYAGLGEAFRQSRGRLGTAGGQDDPNHRVIYYAVACMVLIVMGIGCLIVAWAYSRFVYIAAGCLVVGAICLVQSFVFFKNMSSVRQAVASGLDPDENDPKRMHVMRLALKWGEKNGKVHRDGQGGYTYK